MHFTVGQKKLLTHIKKEKKGSTLIFSLQSANQMLHNRPCFFFILNEKRTSSPHKSPPLYINHFPSNKVNKRN